MKPVLLPLLPPHQNTAAPEPVQALVRTTLALTPPDSAWGWDAHYDADNEVWEVCGWQVPMVEVEDPSSLLTAQGIDLLGLQDAFEEVFGLTLGDQTVSCCGTFRGLAVELVLVTHPDAIAQTPFPWMDHHVDAVETALRRTEPGPEPHPHPYTIN